MDWPRDKLRIVVVEEHNKALDQIYRGIARKRIPFSGIHLVHYDSHPDMTVPEIDAETLFNRTQLLQDLSIENWIVPAVGAGHVSHVTWIHPDWSKQMPDGEYQMTIGLDPKSKMMMIDCPLLYFVEDGFYLPRSLMAPTPLADATLTVADFQKRSTASSTPWLLDIDLDTFSTADPFRDILSPRAVELAEELYGMEYTEQDINQKTSQEILSIAKSRKRRIDILKSISMEIDGGDSKSETLDKDFVVEKERLTPLFHRLMEAAEPWLSDTVENKEPPAHYLHYLLSGWSPGALPHHISDETEVQTMVSDLLEPQLRDFISQSGPPVMVTLARSSNDDYCPPHQVDDIQTAVLQCLRRVLSNSALDIRFDY